MALGYGVYQHVCRYGILNDNGLGPADGLATEALHAVGSIVVDAEGAVWGVELDDGACGAKRRAHPA